MNRIIARTKLPGSTCKTPAMVIALALATLSALAADTTPAKWLLRVAGAQIPVSYDLRKNVLALSRAIEFARLAKADVLVTPEGSLSGYWAGLGARILFVSANAGQDSGPDRPLHRSFHEANLRLCARSAGVWVVVVDAADPPGRKPSNCPSGVVGPDGQWIVQAESKGGQFFVQAIELKSAPSDRAK